jgi:hypothetical protein
MTIIIIHLLGRAPTGDLDCTLRTALGPEPDWCRFEIAPGRCKVTRIRWSLEPAELPDGKKTCAQEKDYDPGFGEGWPVATHVSPFSPEPTAGRKPPAPLAFDFDFDRVAIGCSLD